MEKVTVDDELRTKLDLTESVTELCDADGTPVAYVLSAEEYRSLCYAWAHAEASTPEAAAEIKAADEASARGECISSEQLFAEIEAVIGRRAAS